MVHARGHRLSRLMPILAAALWLVHSAASSANAASPEASLTPFEAEYTVKSAGLKLAYTHFSLSQLEGGAYQYTSSAEATGLLSMFKDATAQEQSRLLATANAVIPLEYSYQLQNGDQSKDYKSVFDWNKKQVVVVDQDSTAVLDVPHGTVDRFILQLAVMLDLQQGRDKLEYRVLEKHRLKKYRFQIIGHETVDTPAGEFSAIKIESIRVRSGKEKITTFWCVPEFDYLPVKITYKTQNKPRYTMSLRKLSGFKPLAKAQ